MTAPIRVFRNFGVAALLAATAMTVSKPAAAYILPLPSSLAHELLSESVPTAFAPAEFTVEDFRLEWVGDPIPDVSLTLEERSLQWVRVAEVLVLPRARLKVEGLNLEGGRVTNAGFSQALEIRDGKGSTMLPVALISGEQNPIDIAIRRGGKEFKGQARIRFKPQKESVAARVFYDPSCSRWGIRTVSKGFRQDEWSYVGCRMVETESEEYRSSSLEVLFFWDNVGQSARVGGVSTPSSSVSVWPLRLKSEPGQIQLGADAHEIELFYGLPKRFHYGAVGAGIGPYSFSFLGDGENILNWTLLPTVYVSYFITESMRVVGFNATTLNKQLINDFGIYLSTEYAKTVDRRITVNLMLGMHALGFRSKSREQYYFIMGVPQGAEVIVTDFLKRANNLTVGGFIYPSISGKSYYNTWLRWGSPQLFYEFNYISWEEPVQDAQFSSRALGLTVGFALPFLRFL